MLSMKMHLGTCSCERCHTRFGYADLLYQFSWEKKIYCRSCAAEIVGDLSQSASDPRVSPKPRADYVVEGNEGKLLLESAFDGLGNGIYEVKYIGPYLAINAVICRGGSIDQIMGGENHYIFEKYDSNFLLFFHPKHFMDPGECYDRQKDYEFIRTMLERHSQHGEARWLCNRQNTVVGIGTIGGADFTLSFVEESFVVAKTMSCEDMKKWLEIVDLNRGVRDALKGLSPKTMLDYCEKRIQGQGIWLRRAVYQVYRYMQSVAQCKDFRAENWILTAPSGSGKTEFYRTIKDFFALYHIPIPVVSIDLSQITEAGYKGDNVKTIPQRILLEKPEAKGIAICFLDEADKKFLPSYGKEGINNNAAVQANLLNLIEGSELKIEVNDEQMDFNSNHTMFVLMGAFQSVRHQKQERQRSSPMGFGSEYKKRDLRSGIDQMDDSFFEDLSLQDMIDFGMREELAGRMVQVVNFHRLSEAAMRDLIRYKANEISEDMGITIEMTETAVEDFLAISFGSLGVRRPMNMIRELVQNAVAEVFFEGSFDIKQDRIIIESTDAAQIERGVYRSECEYC